MSAPDETVTVDYFGRTLQGRVINRTWQPTVAAHDREFVTIDVDGTEITVDSCHIDVP